MLFVDKVSVKASVYQYICFFIIFYAAKTSLSDISIREMFGLAEYYRNVKRKSRGLWPRFPKCL